MPIRFACPECDRKYKVSDDKAGKRARCKECGAIMPVPSASDLTPGGHPVYRHKERDRGFELAMGDSENIEEISDHIEKHLGEISGVYHELVSDLVHIDLHMVPPDGDERPFNVIVTSGMSDLPMTIPDELDHDELAYAELLICLPEDWPLSEDDFEDENNYWPLRLLKQLARLPHEFESWFGYGHSIPNGDPAEPYADDTELCGAVLVPAFFFGEEFMELKTSGGKTINFYAIIPVYNEEMNYKLKHDAGELFDRMEKKLEWIPFVVEPDRPSACRRGLWR